MKPWLFLLALSLFADLGVAFADSSGLDQVDVVFARGSRRERTQVHFPPHPDSDTVYRLTVVPKLSTGASLTRLTLRKHGKTLIDVAKADDAETDLATIVADDFTTRAPNYDGDYVLTLTVNGREVSLPFTARGMNSRSTPRFQAPLDCEVVSEQPRFTWKTSEPQAALPGESRGVRFELISHTEPWHQVLSTALPRGSTAYQVGENPAHIKRLEPATYRDVITEQYVSAPQGPLRLIRQVWAARGFVVGAVECD